MSPNEHRVFARLRDDQARRPLVVAHRGDSAHHPENTAAAFRAAAASGVPMQEFDVRQLACGTLVCVHDATFDRTTDAARRLGPGAQAARTDWRTAQTLDAGGWFDAAHSGERVPSLAEAIAVMLPNAIPLIEHKAGDPARYVAELRRLGVADQCILQSFDWRFLDDVRRLAPEVAVGLLGPNPAFRAPGPTAVATALQLGAGILHWQARELGKVDVERIHAAGLLVCTYTTDDELGWCGGSALGIDAMCTNDPGRMQAWRRARQ